MNSITGKHPKALPYLFLTEMWERFGFYVVQGMLILYMTEGYGFSDDKSYTILGVFSALAYISPMAGGYLADQFLGFKNAIIWGGIFLAIGYAALALSNATDFYFALATIVIGTGLFKPSISSLLGALYTPGDTTRDAGFTIFYVGINLGALLAGFTSGYIKLYFGWHAGFALASLGLVIGLSIFAGGIHAGKIKYSRTLSLTNKRFLQKPWLIGYCLAAIPLLTLILESSLLGNWFLPLLGIGVLIFIFILAYRQTPKHRNRLITLNILIIASVIFWTTWMQIFFSANLFINRLVNKTVFGFVIPTTVFYTLESIFVILLGPLFAWSWQTLNQNKMNPSHFLKFVLALVFAGLGFLVLTMSTYFTDASQLVSPLWIVLAYFLITVGEMLLSPIGLSAVTMLSPAHLTGMMMGVWFVSIGFGGAFAGILAKFASIPSNVTAVPEQLIIYRGAFLHFAYIAFTMAAILFIVQYFVSKKLSVHE